MWFQVLFHSPPGVLFTFPSRYSFTIGRFGYLALERGRPRFPRDSSCPAVLKSKSKTPPSPSPTGLSPSSAALPRVLRLGLRSLWARRPTQALHLQPPLRIGKRTTQRSRFGLLPFRSPLLGESHRFLFLGVLRCFSSPACPRRSKFPPSLTRWESPPGFPHSDIHGSKPARRLPVAFRSLAASFFGPKRPGIHLSPEVASLYFTRFYPGFLPSFYSV